jgi:hypothetical protein
LKFSGEKLKFAGEKKSIHATVREARTGPSKTIPAITALTAIMPVTAVTARSRRE